MKRVFFSTYLLLIAIIFFNVSSSNCAEYWAKTYGGSSQDRAYSIQQTTDGGYIVAGNMNYTGSYLGIPV